MKYKIGELSNLLNVSTNTVRRYEKAGYITSKRSENSNYRYYSEDNITKFMTVRLLRKYGFTHTEIASMKNSEMSSLISAYENRIEKMDEQISYLTSLRHRVKDDLLLMKKVDEFKEVCYIRDCVDLSYVIYQSGDKLLKESKRITTVQDYLYISPEVQRIYLIRKEDIENDNIILNVGWAIKSIHLERYKIEENEYTERYEKRRSLFSLVKLPVKTEDAGKSTNGQLKEILLDKSFKYIEENHFKIDGDVIGVVITNVIEENQEIQYILMCVPIVHR
ncbi:MerR family transcriptional regulator [Clostridium cellulovorans]|uniref:Transcriptional regulator, MerR family n=1 Tax=Clostridium cellulovorans (strain ATCC 35296 / DSM 3052 / OCM 3 / 743B) TaxID=573061 RepID=D9ST64_CLOC7|nr:MerR family transcriptional regulator [Clostridium cellulovorans]ADL50680.1 transcriptional regulator, MerR family [Clostridium cellulovorans 743B]